MMRETAVFQAPRAWVEIILLWLAIAAEAFYYPTLATLAYEALGGRGGPGSSMGYFRDHYIVPGAMVIALLSTVAVLGAAKHGARALRTTLILAWSGNLVAVLASSYWYFGSIRAASDLR